ncbi:MAG: hypothetical protein IKP69_02280 [Oscillospiraceae bacterium]|nr:hypothetical protein [Oscillospiraceae bacterium]
MEMSNEEICRNYRQAKNKSSQIKILADMNLCKVSEIVSVLEENGVQVGVRAKETLERKTDYQPDFKGHNHSKKQTEAVPESPADWKSALKFVAEHISELKQQEETIEAELAEIYQALGEICGRE